MFPECRTVRKVVGYWIHGALVLFMASVLKLHLLRYNGFLAKMQVVYFVNSGTEANELAMLMARLYSGNLSMIALRNAYHGGSAGTIGLTALNTWKYSIPQVNENFIF